MSLDVQLKQDKAQSNAAEKKDRHSIQRLVQLHFVPSQPRATTFYQGVRVRVWIGKHISVRAPKYTSKHYFTDHVDSWTEETRCGASQRWRNRRVVTERIREILLLIECWVLIVLLIRGRRNWCWRRKQSIHPECWWPRWNSQIQGTFLRFRLRWRSTSTIEGNQWRIWDECFAYRTSGPLVWIKGRVLNMEPFVNTWPTVEMAT